MKDEYKMQTSFHDQNKVLLSFAVSFIIFFNMTINCFPYVSDGNRRSSRVSVFGANMNK